MEDRRTEANRRNARLSTGPRTPEGKASSAKNALKHGLLSKDVLLPDESPAEFEEFAQSFQAALNPRGAVAAVQVEIVILAAWRLKRCGKLDAAFWRSFVSGSAVNAAAFIRDSSTHRALDALMRYARMHERTFFKALEAIKGESNQGDEATPAADHRSPSSPSVNVDPGPAAQPRKPKSKAPVEQWKFDFCDKVADDPSIMEEWSPEQLVEAKEVMLEVAEARGIDFSAVGDSRAPEAPPTQRRKLRNEPK